MIRFILVDVEDLHTMAPAGPVYTKFSAAQAAADDILAFTGRPCVVFKSMSLYTAYDNDMHEDNRIQA